MQDSPDIPGVMLEKRTTRRPLTVQREPRFVQARDAMDTRTCPESPDVEAGADCLLASTLYLMGRYAATPCPRLAELVDRHLAAVAANPGCGILVRETSRRLGGDWSRLRHDCPLGFDVPPCAGGG
mgnify:CR=1 FL=1|jgi:hypothetical protein